MEDNCLGEASGSASGFACIKTINLCFGGFFIIVVQCSICCLVEPLTGASGHFTNEENRPETKLRTFQGRTDTQQGLNPGPSSSAR